jgi:hypothetical protein
MSLTVLGYALVLLVLRAARCYTFDRFVPVSLTLVAVSALAPLLVSQVKPIFLAGRTPMFFFPIACLLAGVLMARWGNRLVTGIVVIALANVALLDLAYRFAMPDPFPTSTAVRHVVENAACGDTIVLASLSYSVVDYYWHRFGAPDCIARESFPLSTQSHPGWMDIPGLTNQRDELAAEAAATTRRLAGRGETVWLFYLRSSGAYRDLTDILKWELDRRLALVETLDFRGLYFDSILVYSARVTEP